MNAPRASILVRSAPAALSTTLPSLPPLPFRDHRSRRPRSHYTPCSLSPSLHPSNIVPRPAFLPLSPARIAFNKSSCMVCHTAATATATPPPSDSNNDCSTPKRPAPQPSAVSFVGAVSTAVAVSVTDSQSSTEPVYMDLDTTDRPVIQPPQQQPIPPPSPQLQRRQQQQQPQASQSSQSPQHQQLSTLSSSPQPQTQSQPQQFDATALSTSTVTTADSQLPDLPREQTNLNTSPSLSFRSGIVCIPHPEKVDKGGEDAFFVQKTAMGVFDGVGGWASIGVDAGLYSKELARLTASYVDREGSAAIVDALKSAKENNRAIGSSTACVVGLNGDKLVGVNLGDSGLIVIRNGAVVYRTCEQQHYFNCPYQIGTDSMDTVEVGGAIDLAIQHGDWIVLGTDGLWDNVFPNKVVEIVVGNQEQKGEDCSKRPSDASSDGGSVLSDCSATDTREEDAQTIAQQLAEAALGVANDETSSSPFAVNAQNAGHLFLGGKVDDITIIAALVVDVNHDKTSSKAAVEDVSRRSEQGMVGDITNTDQ